jgi:hypothetical protein
MVVVAYESDLGRIKLNWEKRFTNMYQRSWYSTGKIKKKKRIKPPAFAEVNEARITDTYEIGVIAFRLFWKEAKISELFHPNHCSYYFMVVNLWSDTVMFVHLQIGNCRIVQASRAQAVGTDSAF